MNVHLKGPFFLTQTLLPLLNDGGRIVNISSGLTRFSLPGYAAYATMKGGIEVLTRYLAKELGARGIAVNTLAPGAIETDFGGGGGARQRATQRHDRLANRARARRQPDDIGGAVSALLQSDNRWSMRNGSRCRAVNPSRACQRHRGATMRPHELRRQRDLLHAARRRPARRAAAVFCRFAGCNLWSGREADRASAQCRFATPSSLAPTARSVLVMPTPRSSRSRWPRAGRAAMKARASRC